MTRALLLLTLAARLVAAPVTFWASDPVAPGETVLVLGAGLGTAPRLELTRLPDSPTVGPKTQALRWPATLARPAALQACERSLKFTLPATSQPGVFAYRLFTADGQADGLVNAPRVYWLQGDQGPSASPGGWLRLFGRNLALGAQPRVRLEGPRTLVLNATADTWAARVDLPDLPAGDYRVWLHNGAGGDFAWSAPSTVTLAPAEVWPSKVYDVRDFGAEGRGQRDDTLALQAALDAAGAAGGGVVWLPRGRYRLGDTLRLPRFVTLRGERQDLVSLCLPDTDKPPAALLLGTNHFRVEELTLYASNHGHLIVGDTGDKPGAGHVRLFHVRVRGDIYRGHLKPEEVDARLKADLRLSSGGSDTVRLGGTHLEIGGCDLYGSGRMLYLSRARGAWVHDNLLYNGRWGWYCLSGNDGLIFERNRLQGADLMSTGGGLNCLDGSKFSQNVYYADNELSHMNGWDRESMTSDAGGGPYLGGVTACAGTQVTLASEPKWGGDWTGAGVFVLDGRGAGQVRRVAAHKGAQVTLDQPFDAPLDATSILTITQYQGHYMLLRNRFSDCGAVQFYGTGIDNIVAGNRGQRMQGFHAWALWYYGFQPCIGCQFLGNELSESYFHWSSADDSALSLSGQRHEGYSGPMNLGGVLRGNRLHDNAVIRVRDAVRDVLVEGNEVSDADTGVFVSRSCAQVLVQGNRFARVAHEVLDEVGEARRREERLKRFLGLREPVAVWDFEQLDGGRFADRSGHGLAARVEGGAQRVPGGHTGAGVAFDGRSWLRVDEPAIFNAPDLTIDLWVQPATLSGRRGLVVKRFNGTSCPFSLSQWGDGLAVEGCTDEGAWSFNFRGPSVLKVGQWTRVTVVFKQGEGARLYYDGQLAFNHPNPAHRAGNDEPLILGREAWGGDPPKGDTPGLFSGRLDDVRIWTRALSAEEVARG